MTSSENNESFSPSETQSLLDSAIRKLEIDSIILSSSKCWAANDMAPSPEQAKDGLFQMFVRRSACGSSEAEDQYGFKVSCGIRMVPKEMADAAKQTESDEHTAIEIKAEFLAIYHASEPLTEHEATVFHQRNVLFNVWPYWREFVQSTGARMGAPYMHVRLLKSKHANGTSLT